MFWNLIGQLLAKSQGSADGPESGSVREAVATWGGRKGGREGGGREGGRKGGSLFSHGLVSTHLLPAVAWAAPIAEHSGHTD